MKQCNNCGRILNEIEFHKNGNGTFRYICKDCYNTKRNEKDRQNRLKNTIVPLNKYIKVKIKILKQLGITLNKTEYEHLISLSNEIQIDNYARDLILNRK